MYSIRTDGYAIEIFYSAQRNARCEYRRAALSIGVLEDGEARRRMEGGITGSVALDLMYFNCLQKTLHKSI